MNVEWIYQYVKKEKPKQMEIVQDGGNNVETLENLKESLVCSWHNFAVFKLFFLFFSPSSPSPCRLRSLLEFIKFLTAGEKEDKEQKGSYLTGINRWTDGDHEGDTGGRQSWHQIIWVTVSQGLLKIHCLNLARGIQGRWMGGELDGNKGEKWRKRNNGGRCSHRSRSSKDCNLVF